MKTIADLHMHTSVSQHAYSTLDEIAMAAKFKGFKAFGITNHGPGMLEMCIRDRNTNTRFFMPVLSRTGTMASSRRKFTSCISRGTVLISSANHASLSLPHLMASSKVQRPGQFSRSLSSVCSVSYTHLFTSFRRTI